jgi:hypothetical protein
MSDVPLVFRRAVFTSDRGVTFTAYRPYVVVRFANPPLQPHCFLDTGAPFSVVPHSIARQVPWSSLGRSLTDRGRPVALDWQGLPCEMGEAAIHLGPPAGSVPQHFKLIGKFVLAPHPDPVADSQLLLGMNFLLDNGIDHAIEARSGTLTGRLSIP